MKRNAIKSVTALAVAAGLGIGIPAVASASSDVSVSVQAHTSTTSTPTAWTTWRATWKTYYTGIQTINATFHTAVQTAGQAGVRHDVPGGAASSDHQGRAPGSPRDL